MPDKNKNPNTMHSYDIKPNLNKITTNLPSPTSTNTNIKANNTCSTSLLINDENSNNSNDEINSNLIKSNGKNNSNYLLVKGTNSSGNSTSSSPNKTDSSNSSSFSSSSNLISPTSHVLPATSDLSLNYQNEIESNKLVVNNNNNNNTNIKRETPPSFKRLKTYIAQYENSNKLTTTTASANTSKNTTNESDISMSENDLNEPISKKIDQPASNKSTDQSNNNLIFLSSAECQLKALPYLILNNPQLSNVLSTLTSISNSKTLSTSSTTTTEENNKLLGLANIALEREEST